jgi:hypothetical protein
MPVLLTKRVFVFVFACVLAHQNLFAQRAATSEVQLEFRVRYVTTEAIYFGGGTADGIRPGDAMWLVRNGQKLLPLEVKYVAAHNASCLLDKEVLEKSSVAPSLPPRTDDLIVWRISRQELTKRTRASEPAPEEPTLRLASKTKEPIQTAPKRYATPKVNRPNQLNGQISLQAFGQHDRSTQRYDFFEPSLYLRMNFERPAGLPLRLIARVRSSQNYRQIGAGTVQTQPALHRVYEIGMEYTSPRMPLEIAVGRMLRYDMRGVGYLDGAALGYRVSEGTKAGIFFGVQPDLYRYEFRAEEKKLGGFVQMKTRLGKTSELNFAATGVGQYFRRQVSREYFSGQIDLNFSRRLFLAQYLEVDFNRNWRRQASGSAVALSNAYFNAYYYPHGSLSFGVSYDTRRLIRTWETHALADSLFDRALRQGRRASVSLQPSALTRFTIDGGLQQSKNSPNVYSAGLFGSVSNLLNRGVGVSARFSYFGNALSSGYYPSLDVSRSLFGVLYLTLGGGAYIYRTQNANAAQVNPWERLRLDLTLTRRFFFSATGENFHGETMKFVRAFGDLGWRF